MERMFWMCPSAQGKVLKKKRPYKHVSIFILIGNCSHHYRISKHSFPGTLAEISSEDCKQHCLINGFTVLERISSPRSLGVVALSLVLWMILVRPGKSPRNDKGLPKITVTYSGTYTWTHTDGRIQIYGHFKKWKVFFFSSHKSGWK